MTDWARTEIVKLYTIILGGPEPTSPYMEDGEPWPGDKKDVEAVEAILRAAHRKGLEELREWVIQEGGFIPHSEAVAEIDCRLKQGEPEGGSLGSTSAEVSR